MSNAGREALAAELEHIRDRGLFRNRAPLDSAGIDFTSNDYLGLRHSGSVRAAARAAIDRDGTGAGAARLLGGSAAAGMALEREVARWQGTESALLFPSGYQANLGLLTVLAGAGDVIASDALIHASAIDACRLSRSRVLVFAHSDVGELAARLEANRGARRRIVLVEGVYSMDGDVPPLADVHAVCVEHDAWLVVDEAHAAGLLGERGQGAWPGGDDRALVARVITCGKALAAGGALVVGSAPLCDLLAQRARSFVFSTAPAPAVIAAARAAIRIVQRDRKPAMRALALAERLASRLDLPAPPAAIVPFAIGDAETAVRRAQELQDRGFDVRAVRPPAVPEGTSRLRLVCHAHNDEQQVDALAATLRGTSRRSTHARSRASREHASRVVFVAGTDTGIGKTVVASALVRAFGDHARYFKPVQTGDDDDTATVARLAELSSQRTVPPGVALPLPASPHEAAEAAGREIRLDALRARLAEHQAEDDATRWVVELAGGLLVPYGDGHLQIDWVAAAVAEGAQVVLVARSGLGTLNHTQLSVEALRARGVEPAALVLVGPRHASNAATLANATAIPIVELPELPVVDAGAIAAWARTAPWPSELLDPTPAADAALPARDRRHVWHPYTQHGLDDDPLPVVAADGSWLTLADGSRVLDGISSWWTSLHGHGRPEIIDAVRAQGARLDHVLFAGATHAPAVELAERLVALAPCGLTRVFYSDDGSTAVEVALKIARQAWVQRGEAQRTIFVTLEGGYHGDTVGAMSAGDPDPFFTAYQPLLFDVCRVPVNAQALAEALERLGDRAAGVLIEPLVQGAAGMRMHPPAFVQAVRAACDAHGVPMIADEVMTGFGRTGALFACAKARVAPDLMCLSKGITGGVLPLAATLATEELFAVFSSTDKSEMLFHGHSFTAHPLGCAAALASLDLMERENTVCRLDDLGRRLEAGLRQRLGSARAEQLALRRCGGIVALDLFAGGGYLDDVVGRIRTLARERGCLLRPLGPVLYAMPPASTTDAEADYLAATMADVSELVL